MSEHGYGIRFKDQKDELDFTGGSYVNLMQYTGLKDKNGKEIYEGDVLLIDGKTTKVIESEMGWDWDGASVYGWAIGTENPETESEIIGNIYSNPELIEK